MKSIKNTKKDLKKRGYNNHTFEFTPKYAHIVYVREKHHLYHLPYTQVWRDYKPHNPFNL